MKNILRIDTEAEIGYIYILSYGLPYRELLQLKNWKKTLIFNLI